MSVGPIQMLVVGFGEEAEFKGEILDELERLSNRGLIRVIDLALLRKDSDGDLSLVEVSGLSEEEEVEFGAVIGGLVGLGAAGEEGAIVGAIAGAEAAAEQELGITADVLADFADDLEPDTAVGVLLFEHTWAARLRDLIRANDGFPLMQGFLTPEVLLMVGEELNAVREMEDTIALAQAVEGAALLDALATVEAAETVKTAVAADVVRTLIVAGLIEDAAAQEAVDTLVAAELIEEAALAEASAVVDAAMDAVEEVKTAQLEAEAEES
jgi:uncharacterized membrane protein